MAGTGYMDLGGIATVVRGYRECGLFSNGVTYVRTHSSGGGIEKLYYALSSYFRILTRLVLGRADVIHVHVSSRASFWRKWPIFKMAQLFSKKTVLHLHGSEFMIFFSEECGPRRQRWIRRIFESVDVVLVLSPVWRDLILGIAPRANVEILTNGIPVPAAAPIRELTAGPKTILFLGLLGKRKGIFDVLAVLDELRHDVPEVRLIAGGDGEIEEVRATVASLGLQEHVEVPGWIGQEKKQVLLKSADIFVLPSYNEGLPMSLLEAMAAGLPVVCSNVGGIPTAITEGKDGLLIDPGDRPALKAALLSLLQDPERCRQLGEAAYARVNEEFNVKRKVQWLRKLYLRLVEPAR